ncbi:MAG: DUF3305 domain-containing protein [Burkholderiales bacterium]
MRRRTTSSVASRWQPWQWELAEVLANEPSFGDRPRLLYEDADEQRWLHPGFTVELFKDDAEGYYLNLTTDAPCWFVMWRVEEEPATASVPIALPQAVSLSYHDAGRWLDSQETVEQVDAPPAVLHWLGEFTERHYVPEPKRRQRPQSFRTLSDRFGNPVSITTDKLRKGGGGGEGGKGGGNGGGRGHG